mgnify:CR=1 FL=1
MSNKTVFRYIGNLAKSRAFGIITVATHIEKPKEGSWVVTAGISFCSPKDAFIKAMGRKIAKTRMDDEVRHHKFLVPAGSTCKEISNATYNFIFSIRKEFPRWTIKLFRAEGFLAYDRT